MKPNFVFFFFNVVSPNIIFNTKIDERRLVGRKKTEKSICEYRSEIKEKTTVYLEKFSDKHK